MQSKRIQKLLRKKKSDSGFTLLELLTGLMMSIFVTGALGFGLYQILRTTSKEGLKASARNEASRAIEFISDEIRRARTIDNDLLDDLDGDGVEDDNTAPNFVTTGKTVVLALDIPEISDHIDVDGDGDYIGADDNTGTSERIVYYLKSTSLGNWQGPQVLYRWGPPLDANGDYTEADPWQEEALIDGIDDTAITTSPCDAGDTLNPALGNAAGFYACLSGTNAAQIFLTGGIDTTTGDDTNYTADTKAVARAKNVTVDNEEAPEIFPMNFKTLGAIYNCVPDNPSTVGIDESIPWSMRIDFGNNPIDPDDTTTWVHDPKRKAQPIDISTDNALTITASAIGKSGCLSRGNEGADGTEPLSSYSETVPHTIEFMKDPSDSGYNADAWKTFNGDNTSGTHDDPDVKGDGTVMVYKNDSVIPFGFFDGYDSDGDGTPDQDSLGKFLLDQGYARYTNGSDATNGYTIEGLENNERIIAFEVGQTDQAHPGFDVQDAIFIMSNYEFAEKY